MLLQARRSGGGPGWLLGECEAALKVEEGHLTQTGFPAFERLGETIQFSQMALDDYDWAKNHGLRVELRSLQLCLRFQR